MSNVIYIDKADMLKYVDTLEFKTQYIKIIVLDNENTPLRAIEGRATGGSININGQSAVRRTGTLQLVTEFIEYPEHPYDVMNQVTNIKTLLSMNKRVRIELGVENNGPLYKDYPIFWFTLGTFMIQNASVSYNIQQGIQISLKLMDKMALLNGEMGGTFPAQIIHSPMGEYADGGQTIVEKGVKIRTLIEYLVRDFGELTTAEYRIDVPQQINNLIRWVNEDYNLKITPTKEPYLELVALDYTPQEGEYVYTYNQSIGYTKTDFVYPLDKDLDSKPGETVVSVLDQIQKVLGNYEYFFDLDGVFHFREIQDYLNQGSAIDDLTQAIADKYFFNVLADTESIYSFKNTKLISNYNNNPQYNRVKNDFIVWGKNADKRDIRYHLRLQEIPEDSRLARWKIKFVQHPDNTAKWSIVEATPSPADWGGKGSFITHSDTENEVFFIDMAASDRPLMEGVEGTRTKDDDWRLLNYLEGVYKHRSRQTPFDKELMTNLPLLYQLEYDALDEEGNAIPLDVDKVLKTFFAPIYERNSLTYWVDVINTNDAKLMQTVDIKQFGVETIGKRTKVLNDEQVNCLFSSVNKEVNYFYFEEVDVSGDNDIRMEERYDVDLESNVYVFQIPTEYQFVKEDSSDSVSTVKIYNFWGADPKSCCVGLGTVEIPAYELLRSSLHEYLSYNNNINFSNVPIYHLDVNQRITVDNRESDIYGDYVINTISLPLALNGMMTVNARKAVERI